MPADRRPKSARARASASAVAVSTARAVLIGEQVAAKVRRARTAALRRRAEVIASAPQRAGARARPAVEIEDMIKSVAADPRFPHVRYVDLRGTLPTGANYSDWWGNEMHPTEKGFKAVAQKFADAIAKI